MKWICILHFIRFQHVCGDSIHWGNRDARPSSRNQSSASKTTRSHDRCDMRSRLRAPQSPLHKRTSDKNFSGLRHVPKIHAIATSRVPLLHIDCSVISLAFTYRSRGEKQQRYLNWSGKTRALNRRRDKIDRDYYATEHFWNLNWPSSDSEFAWCKEIRDTRNRAPHLAVRYVRICSIAYPDSLSFVEMMFETAY